MMGLSNAREVSFDLLMRIALLTIILCGKSHGFQRQVRRTWISNKHPHCVISNYYRD